MSTTPSTAVEAPPLSTSTHSGDEKNINAYDATTSHQWEKYTKNRPRYPEELFDRVYAFHEANGGSFDRAHDAGCGPGMTAAALARKFGKIICSDFSQQAIDAAKDMLTATPEFGSGGTTNSHFSFRQSAAEDMASWIEPNSLDLVAMSECLHWTDTARTTAAVAQVLKPGGTFAVWYYSNVQFPDTKEVQRIFEDILDYWCGLRIDYSEVSARTLWIEQTAYDCIAFPESEGWAPGVRRVKFNTKQSEEIWIRSKSRPHMRYPKQIGEKDVLEYIEDAKEWEQEFDLKMFRGWFESIFPRLSDEYLDGQTKRMVEALGSTKKARAVWPLSMILARKKQR